MIYRTTRPLPRSRGLLSILLAARFLSPSTSVAAMASPPPASIKVYYYDFAFWRAECVRMGLFMGGVPFEDVRDVKPAEMKASGKLTFGALPIMDVDGKTLSQTQAMAVYAAKVAGIQPDDPWDAAKVDECISGCTDVTDTIAKTFRLSDEEKVKAREELCAEGGRLRMHLGGLEKICSENGDCGYAVGDSISVADLAIWRLVGWMASGKLDGIPKDYVETTFPSLSKLVASVDSNEKVQEWKSKFPNHYGDK